METEDFDYVIVGSGSAGAVLANRLSADPGNRVLVLEAGGTDRRFFIQMPIGYGRTFHDARVNWRYHTEPVPGLNGRPSYWPRGKVMGGSSSINAMVYVRGHPQDFSDWAAAAPGWGWEDVAPAYRRLECWEGPASPERGADGPLAVRDIADEVHPLCGVYLAAAREAQLPYTPDYNGAEMEGASIYQITTRGGLRASTARCYLRPAMTRPNLALRTHALACEVLMEEGRATGLRYRWRGQERVARARASVVLAAGAINSPQLLQLSGIGPGDLLQAHGIETRRHNVHVGAHLQDHLGLDHLYEARVPTLNQVLRPWLGRLRVGLDFVFRRRGPLTLSINQGGGFVRSSPELRAPDIQLYFSPVSYTRAPPGTRPMLLPDPFPGFLLGHSPCRPTSEGHLAIRSPDPTMAPAIQPNYLDTEEDRALMRTGDRMLRRIAETPALSGIIARKILPEIDDTSDDAIDDYARNHGWSVFHACGTCRMGADPEAAVTDPRLRVHGVAGLRVVDASAFPNITSGNINAPVIMLAERAAEMILADHR
ncbi:GMC family oxidoreductase N-terminal domain-containing protein [Paralimibaculum aggregatum]|uniref:GMC family oxidoreductase N-terminal domain-containing protein n=1 Tax=Paralimibaculum aggregatum TaxID=3036245 RepID=A0ABQ6LF96_9RHOB|nr:GMC family oxidoreductase N-terminal domain-containing protein [Limibaculum sp. NKW23]GMG82009.1 GMC family oxidoreductase N-terminal domain-containing protein [Limibaculum sp. NKW23]